MTELAVRPAALARGVRLKAFTVAWMAGVLPSQRLPVARGAGANRGSGCWSWRGAPRSSSAPAAQAEQAALLGFILPGSTLDQRRVAPAFRPPFDIIHRIAQKAKQAAPDPETACPTLLPLLDELRTYCYEHQIEEIPALLAV
jgi:hypothetical protein